MSTDPDPVYDDEDLHSDGEQWADDEERDRD